ncbi:MAG: hypothetical protein ACLUNQ_03385 [Oscillospiraceae bacterium]
MAEAYAFAAKAGIDLQTTFEATRGGFAGGPVYENKVPKLIKRDYRARRARSRPPARTSSMPSTLPITWAWIRL